MRHGVGGRKFGRPTGHRVMMYRNMITALIQYEKIETTLPKAKELRPMAERLITLGKRGSLHNRRQALTMVTDERAVQKVFDLLARRYADRPGGYTRIVRTRTRVGDAAPMAQLSLVE